MLKESNEYEEFLKSYVDQLKIMFQLTTECEQKSTTINEIELKVQEMKQNKKYDMSASELVKLIDVS